MVPRPNPSLPSLDQRSSINQGLKQPYVFSCTRLVQLQEPDSVIFLEGKAPSSASLIQITLSIQSYAHLLQGAHIWQQGKNFFYLHLH